MVLLKLKVKDGEQTIIDVDFQEKKHSDDYLNLYTMILGENGTGKSFVLRLVTDIFMNIENAVLQTRKPKFQYPSFEVEYCIGDNIYSVVRSSPRKIRAFSNGNEIDYKNIPLPNRILAVSFMVNDKFISSKDTSSAYRYLGVRSSNNCTYTSTILKKVYHNLLSALMNDKQNELNKIFDMIGFDKSYFKIKFYYDREIKYDINRNYTNEMLEFHQYFSDLLFVKNGKEISFESCSSGEKHILFAFVGILGNLQDDSIVLVDEPELSLHPEWQNKYLSQIESIFSSYKNVHFILASHSHFFVSDLPPQKSTLIIFKHQQDSFTSEVLPYDTSAWSAENIIYNVFGLRTTRNYYFEQDLYKLLELMKYPESSKEEIKFYIDKLSKFVLSEEDPLCGLIEEAEGVINV